MASATAPTPTTWTGGQTTGSDAWYKFPFGHGGPDPSTFATGGNWQLPRPGFWGGIPYTQKDTQGNPLSPYANIVDQITASQKMRAPQQFGRWGFGGGFNPYGGYGGGGMGGMGGGQMGGLMQFLMSLMGGRGGMGGMGGLLGMQRGGGMGGMQSRFTGQRPPQSNAMWTPGPSGQSGLSAGSGGFNKPVTNPFPWLEPGGWVDPLAGYKGPIGFGGSTGATMPWYGNQNPLTPEQLQAGYKSNYDYAMQPRTAEQNLAAGQNYLNQIMGYTPIGG